MDIRRAVGVKMGIAPEKLADLSAYRESERYTERERAALAFARAFRVRRNRPFIPLHTKPAQAVKNDFGGGGSVARCVRILDAQKERAAGVLRVKPVEQGRARPADVQVTGGRWRESDANGTSHWSNGVLE